VMDRYFTDFYDPEGLKKAIVMSEILQRKFWFFRLNITRLSKPVF
jgi:hypothetical protein